MSTLQLVRSRKTGSGRCLEGPRARGTTSLLCVAAGTFMVASRYGHWGRFVFFFLSYLPTLLPVIYVASIITYFLSSLLLRAAHGAHYSPFLESTTCGSTSGPSFLSLSVSTYVAALIYLFPRGAHMALHSLYCCIGV
ncbi:hypothetical protein C8J57DRAFT_1328702, partial [Mycena rebaudengoi]